MPCRKYSSTRSKKFLRSLTGSCQKVWSAKTGLLGDLGVSSSKSKECLAIKPSAAEVDESSTEVFFLRNSRCEFLAPVVWPLSPAGGGLKLDQSCGR